MNYISQSPNNCSKGNLKRVLNCTNFPEKEVNRYMSRKNLVLVLTNKRGRKSSLSQFSTQPD